MYEMKTACKENNLKKVKDLIAKDLKQMFGPVSVVKLINYGLLKASQYGSLDIVQYLVSECNGEINNVMIKTAAINRHQDVKNYLVRSLYVRSLL
jgi:hypothetical protein